MNLPVLNAGRLVEPIQYPRDQRPLVVGSCRVDLHTLERERKEEHELAERETVIWVERIESRLDIPLRNYAPI